MYNNTRFTETEETKNGSEMFPGMSNCDPYEYPIGGSGT